MVNLRSFMKIIPGIVLSYNFIPDKCPGSGIPSEFFLIYDPEIGEIQKYYY